MSASVVPAAGPRHPRHPNGDRWRAGPVAGVRRWSGRATAPGDDVTCDDRRDLGLLPLRRGTGGVLAAHGAQRLFGWFGGGGLEGTGQFMESIGYVPGRASATAAGLAEAGGGVLLALGLATPAAGAAAAGAMAGASAVHA